MQNIQCKGTLISVEKPIVMGILNCTSDSFYSGSRKNSTAEIIQEVEKQLNEGADIIDIGAISTRPSSNEFISEEEELNRLSKTLSIINANFSNTIISIDTFRAPVAEYCVKEYGVAMINDISGGYDNNMFKTIAALNVPYILMHLQGDIHTMHTNTSYDDLLVNICQYFHKKIDQLRELGAKDIILDPGFGFSKTIDQNFELLKKIDYLRTFDLPLLAGISRKSMLYKTLNVSPEESLNATTVANTFALIGGASILRVHDVKQAKEAIEIVGKIKTA